MGLNLTHVKCMDNHCRPGSGSLTVLAGMCNYFRLRSFMNKLCNPSCAHMHKIQQNAAVRPLTREPASCLKGAFLGSNTSVGREVKQRSLQWGRHGRNCWQCRRT
jgi:hypothetical protein